ncbi:MAG: gliding motility-associated C-terminal domain-containing protein [Bacteroidetes bacterium]|nr:gliding motility-associated C-terminal domain-containing protein [Bacteroidota bacterium]
MVKKDFTRFWSVCLLFLGLFFLSTNEARASHAMGADISYVCLDPVNRIYQVTINFYRDCGGIEAPSSITLNVSSLLCGQSFSMDLPQQTPAPNPNGGIDGEVSPLCSSVIALSSCRQGTLPGVQTFAYMDTVILPSACADWVFSMTVSARNELITNLLNASSEALYVESRLDNTVFANNRSPVFTTLPVPFICVNQPFSYNHGAVDADGDSLAFTLVNPLGAGAVPISYNFPFSPTQPIATASGFNFNGTTGQMSFTPNSIQVAVVTVLVQEYRTGILIGTTMRDMQIVVVNIPGCGSPAPVFTGNIASSVQGGYAIDTSLVQVCPAVPLSFSVEAYDKNGDSLFVESNISQSIPGARFNVVRSSKDSLQGNFSWTPSGLDTGRHTFIIIIRNDHCPLASSQAYALTIDVLAGTTAGPDLYYCPSGGAVQLQAYGGSQFTWSPTLFLSDPNASNPLASPKQSTTYVVSSNLSSTCKNKDSVTVFRVSDFDFTLNQSKDTICLYDIVQFNVVGDSLNAPYRYEWTPVAGLNGVNISNPYARPSVTTNYQVLITSEKTGCSRKDTARVVLGGGKGPQIILSADKNNVCAGDTIHIDSYVSTISCGVNTVPCTGLASVFQPGADTSLSAGGNTPYNNFYTSGRIQMLFLATELRDLGVKPGTIQSISFDVAAKRSTQPYRNLTIRMGCTERNFMSAFNAGLTQVYFSSIYNTVAGINTHVLNTPFNWDGISNLLVDVCFTNNQSSSDDRVRVSRTNFNSITSGAMDGQVGCNLPVAGTFVSTSSIRPNVRFDYCTPPAPHITYSWSPSANVHTPDIQSPSVVMGQNGGTYILTARDSSCQGSQGIILNVDTSYKIDLGPDVPLCDGIAVQLGAIVSGSPPREELIGCGTNTANCAETPIQKDLNRAGLQSSVNSMFSGNANGTIRNQRTQILYRRDDLLTAGFSRGAISKIGFRLANKNTTLPFQNLNIGLGCTGNLELTDMAWESVTPVFNAVIYSTITGWNEFTLQNNFTWDGKANIVVEICWSMTDSSQTLTDPIIISTTTYNALHLGTSDTTLGCSIGVPTFKIYKQLPEIRMIVCPPPQLPITYSWFPPTGLTNDTIPNPTANPLQKTIYTVTAYFGGKCPKIDTIVITPRTVVPVLTKDTVICLGSGIILEASGGDLFAWSPADGLSCTNCASPVASPTVTTTYHIMVTDATTGCNQSDSVVVVVESLTIEPLFTDTIIDPGAPTILGAMAEGGSGQYTYFWSPAEYLNDVSLPEPVATPLADIIYTLIVTSGPCVDSTQLNIRVNRKEDNVKLPDAFTPNGDGRNDLFGPISQFGIATIKTFRIYNRYGQVVHDDTTEWDGTFKGVKQPVGTYVYYLTMKIPFYDDQNYSGSVTLLR